MESKIRVSFLDGNNGHTVLYFESVESAKQWLKGRYELSLVEIRVLAFEPEDDSYDIADEIENE